MSRKKRNLQPGFSYHVTTRCNNREFNLARRERRKVFLYAIKKALDKYGFKLYHRSRCQVSKCPQVMEVAQKFIQANRACC